MLDIEFVEEATKKLSQDNLPVYYKYRYTFTRDEQDEEVQKEKVRRMVKFISTHYMLGTQLVAGIEHFTKGMIKTKAHVHIHFISKFTSDTIRKGLMREFSMIGRCQSCKAEVIVDEPKYWRYPLKQQKNESYVYYCKMGFEQQMIKEMIEVAYACWKQAAEIYVGKAEKKLERTSKDRLHQYLEDIPFESEKQMIVEAYKYYVEHEDNFNYMTVDGYVHIFLLKKGYIGYNEFYNKHHNI